MQLAIAAQAGAHAAKYSGSREFPGQPEDVAQQVYDARSLEDVQLLHRRYTNVLSPEDLLLLLNHTRKALPPDSWLAPFCFRCREEMLAFTPHHLSVTLWAFAVLRARPSAAVVASLALEAQVKLRGLSPQGAANLVWSLATLGYQPSALWTRSVLAHVGGILPACHAPVTLCNIAWGLARWQCRPGAAWLERFSCVATKHVPVMKRVNLVVLVDSMAELGYEPDAQWVTTVLRAFQEQPERGSDDCSVWFVVAVAKLLRARLWGGAEAAEWQGWLQKHRGLLSRLVADCQASVVTLSEKQVVALVVALQQLGVRPEQQFLDELLDGVEQRKASLSVYQYAAVCKAFDVLHGLPVSSRS